MRIFQKGFNFGQDGRGNRLVYHMVGCNLFCPWCANSEGLFTQGKEISCEEIVQESENCKAMFFSGGGITFTGGEPTCQFEELKKALTGLKNAGIHTCIETNATNPELPSLFPLIDQFIMDYKHVDQEKLNKIGANQHNIEKNLKAAIQFYEKIWVRVPLIQDFNAEDLEHFKVYFEQFDSQKIILEILPYHEYGKSKWQELGREYPEKNGKVKEEVLRKWKNWTQKN